MLTGEMGRRRMIVVVPAWGDDYCRLFLGPVLRTHKAALEALRQEFANTVEVRYVVQTDRPTAVARALEGIDLTLVPTPAPSGSSSRPFARATPGGSRTPGSWTGWSS
jgi:hypothetical protein